MNHPTGTKGESPLVTARESTHWRAIARRWSLLGSPLRPAAEDVAIYHRIVSEWSAANGAPRALILGVTPEIYNLSWPAGADIAAVDRNGEMIRAVWPGPENAVTCANWIEIPHAGASRDIAFLDGGLHLLSWPDEQRAFAREIARIVAPGGLFVVRLFVPPAEREIPEMVFADLFAGNVRDLNILKLRLGMSLQEFPGGGVKLANVWQSLHDAAPDFVALANRIGWEVDHLFAIGSYKDSQDEYCFVTMEQALEIFCSDGNFELVSHEHPAIMLGERCPILVFRRT